MNLARFYQYPVLLKAGRACSHKEETKAKPDTGEYKIRPYILTVNCMQAGY